MFCRSAGVSVCGSGFPEDGSGGSRVSIISRPSRVLNSRMRSRCVAMTLSAVRMMDLRVVASRV